jgi:O-antigen/teichoic acid export membrane protein
LIWLGIPFLLVTTLTLAYGRVEVTILGLFGRTALAGSYHVIYQLVLLVYSVAGMFFTVTYPRLYRHRGNDTALLDDFRDTARWLSLLGWIAAPPLWLFAQPILNLMGGTGLTAYAPLLQVLAVMVLIIPASAALNFLLPADMLRVRVGCDATGIAITAGIAAWAAANDRSVWVAAGAVIGYAAAMILSQVALQRKLRGLTHILLQEFAQIGARILPGAALVWWMPGDWWQKLFAFAATGAAFLFTYRPIAQRLRFWIRSAPRE